MPIRHWAWIIAYLPWAVAGVCLCLSWRARRSGRVWYSRVLRRQRLVALGFASVALVCGAVAIVAAARPARSFYVITGLETLVVALLLYSVLKAKPNA